MVLLTEVYLAGEAPIVAADGRALARACVWLALEPVFVEQVAELPAAIMEFVRDGDVVLTMGAGSIGATPGSWPPRVDEEAGMKQYGKVAVMFLAPPPSGKSR